MPPGDVVLVDALHGVELSPAHPPIYDRPIGLKLLHRDPDTGAEHYLIRYPAGVLSQLHRHTAAHTIVVLEGALEANGEVIEAPAYAHFAAGEAMTHQPANGDPCLFVVLFDGPFDAEPVSD